MSEYKNGGFGRSIWLFIVAAGLVLCTSPSFGFRQASATNCDIVTLPFTNSDYFTNSSLPATAYNRYMYSDESMTYHWDCKDPAELVNYPIQLVTNGGRYVLKCSVEPYVSGTTNTQRSEIRTITDIPYGQPNYFTTDMMTPARPGKTFIFWQIHGGTGATAPPLTLKMVSGKGYAFWRNFPDEKSVLFQDYLPTNIWNKYQIEYTMQTNNLGRLRLYVNDEKKMAFDGMTITPDQASYGLCFEKFGLYGAGYIRGLTNYFDDASWSQICPWGSTSEVIPVNGLIGQWEFNEPYSASNTTSYGMPSTVAWDSSGGCSYVGSIRGGAGRTNGYLGTAISLDGADDYVYIPESDIWDTGGAITVSCWLKTTNGTQTSKGLVARDSGGYTYLLMLNASNSVKFYVSGQATSVSSGSGVNFADGKWHHVAGVYDKNGHHELYVDGILRGDNTGNGQDIPDGDQGLAIGSYNGGHFFNGAIDQVRIYNYGLSAKGIITDAGQKCMAHWNFDDDSGFPQDCFSSDNSLMPGSNSDLTRDTGYSGNGLVLTADTYGANTVPKMWDGSGSNVTVSCRFKTGVTQSSVGLVSCDSDVDDTYRYRLRFSNSSLSFQVKTPSGIANTTVAGTFNDDKWHHVVGVYDRNLSSARLKIYADGIAGAPAAGYNDNISSCTSSAVRVGATETNYFIGLIDDVSIYNAALSASEVINMYKGSVCNYDFNEGRSLVVADSSYMHSPAGTLYNGATWTTGYTGSALSFDGINDYISFPENTVWEIRDQITVACRFKAGANQTTKTLVCGDGITSGSYNYMLYMVNNSGDIRFYVTAGGTAYNAYVNFPDNYFADGTWHHVVGIYDKSAPAGSELKICVDGTWAFYASNIDASIDPAQSLTVGKRSSLYFNGIIDDVKIYNRALTTTEAESYTAGN